MTTNNSVNSPLAGTTGTGNFVGSNSPTLITPTLGAAIATTIAFDPTTGGLIGTQNADDADSGIVGEVKSSVRLLASAVSLTTDTFSNIVTLVLTAGDWDVWANVFFTPSVGASQMLTWISTDGTIPPDPALLNQISTTTAILTGSGIQAPYVRLNLNGFTITYLGAQASFAAGTVTACGGLFARRAR